MLATRYATHRQRGGRLAARLMLCLALSLSGLAAPPLQPSPPSLPPR